MGAKLKSPQFLQGWLLARTSVSRKERRDRRRRSSTPSPARTGMTSRPPPCSAHRCVARLSSPAPRAPSSPATPSRAACWRCPSATSTRTRTTPTGRSPSAWRTYRARCAAATSGAWTSPPTSSARSSASGSRCEANADVKTVDGYVLRCFFIGFTKKRPFQIRKTSYAQSAQIRAIRKKMTEIMTKEVGSVEMIKAVEKFVPEFIGKDIMKACEGIYPPQNVYIRKVKILKAPKFDATKLAEIHAGPSG